MRWDTDSKESKKQLRPDQMLLACVIFGVIGASVLSIFVAGTQAISLFLLAGFLVGLAVGSTVVTPNVIKQRESPECIKSAY